MVDAIPAERIELKGSVLEPAIVQRLAADQVPRDSAQECRREGVQEFGELVVREAMSFEGASDSHQISGYMGESGDVVTVNWMAELFKTTPSKEYARDHPMPTYWLQDLSMAQCSFHIRNRCAHGVGIN